MKWKVGLPKNHFKLGLYRELIGIIATNPKACSSDSAEAAGEAK